MITLKNKYLVKKMVKTQSKAFKDIKEGDIIEISLELTHKRSRGSLIAYYPKINNNSSFNIPTLNLLLSKGMELEEI